MVSCISSIFFLALSIFVTRILLFLIAMLLVLESCVMVFFMVFSRVVHCLFRCKAFLASCFSNFIVISLMIVLVLVFNWFLKFVHRFVQEVMVSLDIPFMISCCPCDDL